MPYTNAAAARDLTVNGNYFDFPQYLCSLLRRLWDSDTPLRGRSLSIDRVWNRFHYERVFVLGTEGSKSLIMSNRHDVSTQHWTVSSIWVSLYMTSPINCLLKYQGWGINPYVTVFAMQILNLQYGQNQDGMMLIFRNLSVVKKAELAQRRWATFMTIMVLPKYKNGKNTQLCRLDHFTQPQQYI